MTKVWFTSDQHFGHTNVIKYCNRPFASVDEMNAELVRRHNALVEPGDVVYHLGDFSLSKERVREFLPQLNGTHHLVMGNHDHCHPVMAKSSDKALRMREFYKECGFQTIQLRIEVDALGYGVLLHHMPYLNEQSEQYDQRYREWRPKDQGAWLLHGHVHTNWKVLGRMINVGVDQWAYAPVSIDEIVEIIRNGVS